MYRQERRSQEGLEWNSMTEVNVYADSVILLEKNVNTPASQKLTRSGPSYKLIWKQI
jgi:hypothetical protein